MTYPKPCDPMPHTPTDATIYRLYTVRVGERGDSCDACRKKIRPNALAVVRTDGLLFCTEGCGREHPAPCPISDARPV
jgi:hypothetical protein